MDQSLTYSKTGRVIVSHLLPSDESVLPNMFLANKRQNRPKFVNTNPFYHLIFTCREKILNMFR